MGVGRERIGRSLGRKRGFGKDGRILQLGLNVKPPPIWGEFKEESKDEFWRVSKNSTNPSHCLKIIPNKGRVDRS
jgi:hypothetical protein